MKLESSQLTLLLSNSTLGGVQCYTFQPHTIIKITKSCALV